MRRPSSVPALPTSASKCAVLHLLLVERVRRRVLGAVVAGTGGAAALGAVVARAKKKGRDIDERKAMPKQGIAHTGR